MLADKVREAVFESLSSSPVTFKHGADRNRELLRCLLENGVIAEEETRESIHHGLMKFGRKCYEDHMKRRIPPDHHHPNTFAYAIANGAFTPEELQEIRFDHSDTPEQFVRRYHRRNLIEHIFADLQTPKRSPTAHFSDCEVCC